MGKFAIGNTVRLSLSVVMESAAVRAAEAIAELVATPML